VDEAVTQYTVEEVKQLLYENEAKPEDAQILLAIAYLESKFNMSAEVKAKILVGAKL
jgi:hypothetical protein